MEECDKSYAPTLKYFSSAMYTKSVNNAFDRLSTRTWGLRCYHISYVTVKLVKIKVKY